MTELGKLLWEAVEPETPPERLREIALGTDDVDILGAVARNPSCPADVLEYLAGFPNPHLPESVAMNPKAPTHLLEKLAESEWRRVRYEVGRNPSAPVHILEKLAQDGDDLVRMAVAENPSAPIPLLEKLAKDPSTTVRASLVWNPRLPMRILEALSRDPEPYVRREVEARKKEKEVLFIVKESPEGGYVALARRAKHRVAQAVGASIYTQAETFEELKEKVLDAVRLHFEGEKGPEAVRLSLVIPLRED